MSKEYKHWNTEKKLIPVMIRTYCRGNHKTERKAEGVKGKELCSKCKELAEYAAFRLEKCPFKRNKGFCSYCKIHCYKPEYRAEMKEVMKYSGPKMLFSHPIFAMSHVTAMIKYKKQLKNRQRGSRTKTRERKRFGLRRQTIKRRTRSKQMIDKELFRLIGGNKKYIFIAVALQVLGLIANVSITASVCYAVYLLSKNAEAVLFIYPLIGAVLGIAVRYTCSRITGDIKDKLGRGVKRDLREKVYNKILRLGVKTTDGMSMAGLTQVSLEGVEQLDIYFSSYLPQFFFAMIAPVALFLICVWIDWRTALVLICCVPLIPVSIVAVSKYAKKVFAKYWGKYTSMGDKFLDSVQGLKELKIFQADAAQHVKINESAEEFRVITMKVLVMQLVSITIMDLVAYGGAGIGIGLAICGAAFWGLNPIAALFLCLVSVEFFLPLRAFGSAFHVAMNGVSAGKKIISLLNTPDPEWGTETLDGNKDIRLENVTFSYDGKREVLKNVNMTFPEKGMTAIVGESGCGKSTVVNMLIGAFRPQKGEVTVGGKALEKLSRENWYSHLSAVSYNTYIFNESVRDNFKMAKENVSDEEIFAALEKVNLKEFIEENGGLDKVITEDANNISGGQKQRLALAIALVSGKDIYVFDEATSNIDIESEAVIMKNIKAISESRSVIVISHRLANVVPADNIYYMEDGEIKESGAHDELMAANKGYARLYNTQKTLEQGYTEAIA